MLALPDEPRVVSTWLFEMRRRASGVVEKHWGRILAFADVLGARGELCRDEVLAAARWNPKAPPGPSAPLPAAAVAIARCDSLEALKKRLTSVDTRQPRTIPT